MLRRALQALAATAAAAAVLAAGADPASRGQTRVYYIAAVPVRWDYAPSGRNLITGKPFTADENIFVKRGPGRIGKVYWKALYRGYTDGTFAHQIQRGPRWRHLGLLGPVIHAEVGDTIRVVFRNKLPFPASIHPHGVFYDKASEGAPYADGTAGKEKTDDAVRPGGTVTYVWKVPERAGPGPMDGSSVLWMYHSHTDEVRDTNTGLVGPIIITKRGMARPDGSPKDVDREIVTYFSVVNENQSRFLTRNLRGIGKVNIDDPEFGESNLMHSINGYVYGNLPGLTMRKGEHVRWYVMDLGTEVDLHTPHWHGNTVLIIGMRTDNAHLLPGDMVVADMQPDDIGTWLYHCHVNDHILAGMQALYHVLPARR